MREPQTSFLQRLMPKNAFARGVGLLAGGAVLGQAVVVLASPVLTRLYSPDDFGLLAVFSSVLGILAVIASLRYEIAIPLPEDESEAANILVLALLLVMVTAGLSGVAVLLFSSRIVAATNSPELEPYIWLIPLGVLLAGWYQVLNYWAVRHAAFGAIARTRLAQGSSSVITQVGLGLLGAGPFGLLAGQVLGRAAGTTTLASHTLKSAATALKTVSLASAFQLAARYRRFPLFSSWSSLANSLSSQIPSLLLAFYFGPGVTGLYALGHRVLQAPMSLLGSSIGQVFFSRAATYKREGRLEELVVSVFGALVRVGFPALAIVALTAPELFALAFGPDWREAGVYAQWLSPWLLLVFVSSPLSTLPSILERQGMEFAFQSALLGSRAIALVIGGLLENAAVAIALYALVSALFWSYFMLWNLSIAGVAAGKSLRHLMRSAAGSLHLLLPVAIGKALSVAVREDVFVVVAAAISGLLVCYTILREIRSRASS